MSVTSRNFRADIQGLRAVAVVPIVMLHAGIQTLPGGFLGVDVFFVISGYLITRIITNEIARNDFTFLGFYKRRAVRIFPAFMAMIVITTVTGMILMIRPIFAVNAESAAFSTVFLSNIYFWRNTDYFSPSSHIYMYLHTWSLAVEEQFYIFYPVLLVFLNRFFKHRVGEAVVVAVIGSLIISLLFYYHASGWAFFLLPSRAWQLGLGAMVALNQFPVVRQSSARAGLACAGLAMIGASFLLIDQNWQIPAPWALPASLGAAMLIAYGDRGPTATLLSVSPVAWVGTISYSLYLWHWPIIVLHNVAVGHSKSGWQIVALLTASVIAGAISYYIIEQPVMQRLRQQSAKRIVFTSGGLIAALAVTILGIANMPENWSTFPPDARRVAGYFDYAKTPLSRQQTRLDVCFSNLGALRYDEALCTRQAAGRPTLALVGDSHAAQYYLALRLRYPDHNIIQVTGAGCSLLLNAEGDARCNSLNQVFYNRLVATRRFDRIYLAHRWQEANLQPLQQTIAFLKARKLAVTVIGPVAQFSDSFPLLLANAMKENAPEGVEKYRLAAPVKIDALMAKKVTGWGADYYSVQSAECPKGVCRYLAPDGVPIHFDYGHVTQSGAEFLLGALPRS
jgi:peptidoglycan/LPS O-acetylase OafA/YrhL